MGVLTNLLKLLKPGENDYYNQQTEQADNWDKVDNYAVLTNTDKNGIWGGEYGGKIQDPIPKELNKRYIDNINGKAFICIKAGDSSVTSNTTEYFTPCNVVDNLDKLHNLILSSERVTKIDNGNTKVAIVNCHVDIEGSILGSGGEILSLGIYGNDIIDGSQGAGTMSDMANNFIPCTFLKNSANKVQIFFEKDKMSATGIYSIRGSLISFSSSKKLY